MYKVEGVACLRARREIGKVGRKGLRKPILQIMGKLPFYLPLSRKEGGRNFVYWREEERGEWRHP